MQIPFNPTHIYVKVSVAVCPFPDTPSAINAAISILGEGIDVARIEFLDGLSMEACKSYSNIPYECTPTLFIEFHSHSKQGMDEMIQRTKSVATSCGSTNFAAASDPDQRAALWKARHECYYACKALKPNSHALSTDVCVPISNLSKMVLGAQLLLETNHLTGQFIFLVLLMYKNNVQRTFSLTFSLSLMSVNVSNCQWYMFIMFVCVYASYQKDWYMFTVSMTVSLMAMSLHFQHSYLCYVPLNDRLMDLLRRTNSTAIDKHQLPHVTTTHEPSTNWCMC